MKETTQGELTELNKTNIKVRKVVKNNSARIKIVEQGLQLNAQGWKAKQIAAHFDIGLSTYQRWCKDFSHRVFLKTKMQTSVKKVQPLIAPPQNELNALREENILLRSKLGEILLAQALGQ